MRRTLSHLSIALALTVVSLSLVHAGEGTWEHPDECTEVDRHFWEDQWRDCELQTVMQNPEEGTTTCTYICSGIPATCYKYIRVD
jgi:hypothetical protein